MYNRNTERNKFSEQHQDVAALVPTSTQVFTDMFQYSIEHQHGTCTHNMLRKINSQINIKMLQHQCQHLHIAWKSCKINATTENTGIQK